MKCILTLVLIYSCINGIFTNGTFPNESNVIHWKREKTTISPLSLHPYITLGVGEGEGVQGEEVGCDRENNSPVTSIQPYIIACYSVTERKYCLIMIVVIKNTNKTKQSNAIKSSTTVIIYLMC